MVDASSAPSAHRHHVLFVCTHNAGRSQMAQAFFERDAPADVIADSAGTQPARKIWPSVVEVMREVGIDLSGSAAVEEAFLTAASPGVIALVLENRSYPSHEAYVGALADAMKIEYDAIHRAGIVLQLDCPDLAAGRHTQFGQ